jgi:hypothetical protein
VQRSEPEAPGVPVPSGYLRPPYVVHVVYDDVQVQRPQRVKVQSVPKASDTGRALRYQASASAQGRSLHLTRQPGGRAG